MKRNLQTPVSLAEIAQVLGAELRGDPSVTVRRLASLRKADTESISFLVRPQQREAAHASHAVAYISPRLVDDLPADADGGGLGAGDQGRYDDVVVEPRGDLAAVLAATARS